ncbi:MAG: 2-hydroxyacyl-CoA dehydratase, partial [Deltaproteobacteria bacterium]|nr:2-hydroxyacyl-CoA dehydratase [Deltaproteobacteria bacterium]
MQTDAGNTVKDAQMMEARLQSLLGAAAPENRYRWAKEEKSQGRKVIGTVSPYVPEEMIYAAGMIPLRLWGSNQAALVKASAHRPPFTNSYHTRLLESLLSGELDFLDGLVATDADDSLKRMWDVWVSTKRTKFNYIIHVPNTDSNTAKGYFALSLRTFLSSLESFADVRVGSEALIESVNLHNLLRSLMRRV